MPKPVRFIFTRRNYSLILTSVCLMILGYILMTGKGNTETSHFNESIYSIRRITISPLVILAGYALMIYAIMSKKGRSENSRNGHS